MNQDAAIIKIFESASLYNKYGRSLVRSYFHGNCVEESFGFSPEFLVHCQVDEEVADVVYVVEKHQQFVLRQIIKNQQWWYKADDVDDSDEDKLCSCQNVTSVAL